MAYTVNRYVQNIMAAIENTDLWDEPKIFSMPLLDSASLTTFNGASVGTESISGTLMRYNSDPNQDKWPIWEACILGASEYTLSSWIYVHLLGMSVGETLWFYNARFGRANAIGFKKTTTSAGGTTAAADIIVRVSSTNYSYASSVVVGGTDSSSRIRQFAFTAITDNDNHYAIPIYFYGARHDPMQNGDNVRPQMNAFTNSAWLSVRTGIYTLFSDIYVPPAPSTDPYAGGGTSTDTDSGSGDFDDSSDDIPIPTPSSTIGAFQGALISQYCVGQPRMALFASWLWDPGISWDDIKRVFSDPMQALINVGILPYTPSDTDTYEIYVGNLDTGVTGELINNSIDEIDMGTVDINDFYGSALDHNPYTKIELFLPYCGVVPINPDEFTGHEIGVVYHVDSLTGDCVAFVSDENRVLMQVRGNCMVCIPYANANYTQVFTSVVGAVAAIGAGVATAAASGGLSAPIVAGMATSVGLNAMNAKTNYSHGGAVSGMAGYMGVQKPYLIITRPRQCLPEDNAIYRGYPCMVTKTLSDFVGFTVVHEIHLDGLSCTDAEAKELYTLLKGGVVL